MRKKSTLFEKVFSGSEKVFSGSLRLLASKGPGHECNSDCRRVGHTYLSKLDGVNVFEAPDGSIVIQACEQLSGVARAVRGRINSEPNLVNGSVSSTSDDPLLFSYVFVKGAQGETRPVLNNPPQSFELHPPGAVFTSRQLARLKGCNRTTVARHVRYGWLRFYKQVGKDFFFRKKDILAWLQTPPLKKGRPSKKG